MGSASLSKHKCLKPNIKNRRGEKTDNALYREKEREEDRECFFFFPFPISFPPIFSFLYSAVVCPDLAASMAHPSWAA